jgi:hypothetical protein
VIVAPLRIVVEEDRHRLFAKKQGGQEASGTKPSVDQDKVRLYKFRVRQIDIG